METDFYTPAEVAGLMRLTRETIYKEMKQGDLQSYRLGRSHRISRVQIIEWLQQSTNRTTVI
jgi:excisionase family DNA binding protein